MTLLQNLKRIGTGSLVFFFLIIQVASTDSNGKQYVAPTLKDFDEMKKSIGAVYIDPVSWKNLSVEDSIKIVKIIGSSKDIEVSNDFDSMKIFSTTYKEEFIPILKKKISIDFSGGSFYDLTEIFLESADSLLSVSWYNRRVSFVPFGFFDYYTLFDSILFEKESREETSGIPVKFLVDLMNRRSEENRLHIKVLIDRDSFEGGARVLLDTRKLEIGDVVTVKNCLLMLRDQFSLKISLDTDGNILLSGTKD